jgi:carbonic anhydrase
VTKKAKLLMGVVAGAVLLLVWVFFTDAGRRTQFIFGGAMVNLGYRLQDHLASYDFEHEHDISPDDVWKEMQKQNALAATVRKWFPRTARHPLVAMVVCMDARLDTNELTGDTRRYYYIIRTAGSVLSEKEEEMLELAVANGVELIMLSTHSDCAAEKAAASPDMRQRYPALAKAVDEREQRINELLARPAIASKIAAGKLAVKLINIDTMTERMLPR